MFGSTVEKRDYSQFKRFSGSPFGSQVIRFSRKGAHPELVKTAIPSPYDIQDNEAKRRQLFPYSEEMSPSKAEQSKPMDEGARNKRPDIEELTAKKVARMRKRLLKALKVQQKKRVPGIDWKRTQDLERWAKIPYVLYYEQYHKDKLRKARLGPGRYYHHDLIHLPKGFDIPGIMAAKVPRFFVPVKLASTTPGPGTYGLGGIPSINGTRGKELFGKHTCIQSCSGHVTFTAQEKASGSGLGPATYQRTKGPLDQYLNKIVGARGPYDTFTGDRLALIKFGHLAAQEPTDFFPYNPPSILQEQMANKHRGKFLQSNHSSRPAGRIILEDKSNPWAIKTSIIGPGSYDPKLKIQTVHHKLIPFNSNTQRFHPLFVRKYTGNYHLCGPGRYHLEKKVKFFNKFKELPRISGKQTKATIRVNPVNLEASDYMQRKLVE